ncbi:MAG: hypothetical protein RLZZ584_4050, partial [Pseudomonadota bacterium]
MQLITCTPASASASPPTAGSAAITRPARPSLRLALAAATGALLAAGP